MENEEKATRLIELVKKAIASLPQPHDVRTREHFEQCDECREWRRAVEDSFEKIETNEGMRSGELGMLMFMAVVEKAIRQAQVGFCHFCTSAVSSSPKSTCIFSPPSMIARR
jgi:hypothetical protein